MIQITGKLDSRRSWEKQKFYKLSNGWTAIIEYNQIYGDFVKGLLSKSEKWYASGGTPPPDFAKGWHDGKLVRPNFKQTN